MRTFLAAWVLFGLNACAPRSGHPPHVESREVAHSDATRASSHDVREGVTGATSVLPSLPSLPSPLIAPSTDPAPSPTPACERGRAWDGAACVWAVCSSGMHFRVGAGCIQADGMRCVVAECGETSFHSGEHSRPSTPSTASASFDADRTKDALRAVDLSPCEGESGPRGWAELGLVVNPEGRVTDVTTTGSLTRTEKAKCVSALLFTRSLETFRGSPRSLHVDVFVP